MNHDVSPKEKTLLTHAPVPGYRPVFMTIFAVACVYLAYLLLTTL